MEKDAPTSPIIKRSRPYKKVSPKESVEEGCICSEWAQDISCTAHSYLEDVPCVVGGQQVGDVPPAVDTEEVGDVPGHDDGGNAHEESINSDHQFPPTPQKPSIRRKRRSAYSVPTDLGSTETLKESVSLLDQDLGSTETQEESVSLLDQNLGSTETQKESVSLMDQDLGSTETQKESVSLLDQNLGSTETQEESVSLLDQDLGSTETHMESQSLLKKEKADEESNRAKLSAKLCNGMFPWSLDLEQDNI